MSVSFFLSAAIFLNSSCSRFSISIFELTSCRRFCNSGSSSAPALIRIQKPRELSIGQLDLFFQPIILLDRHVLL
jgi:hypothetical protein